VLGDLSRIQGFHLLWLVSKRFVFLRPLKISLATTFFISVDFNSFRYLDVSVHEVSIIVVFWETHSFIQEDNPLKVIFR